MLVKKRLDNILNPKVNRSGAHSSDAPKESAVFCARTSIKRNGLLLVHSVLCLLLDQHEMRQW